MITTPKPRGRPKTGRKAQVQFHFYLDLETRQQLRKLADGNESAYLRFLINNEYRKWVTFL